MRNSRQLSAHKGMTHPSPELTPDNYCHIIEAERNNCRHINLYNVGNDWIAFEQSAYMLSFILPKCSVLRANFSGYPFPVIIAIIGDNALREYTLKHIISKISPSHYILLGKPFDITTYNNWHRRQLKM